VVGVAGTTRFARSLSIDPHPVNREVAATVAYDSVRRDPPPLLSWASIPSLIVAERMAALTTPAAR